MSAVWDCVFFNDELDLLETRLRELDGVVDHFVVVEGDRTYSGTPKTSTFDANRKRFSAWSDQIVNVRASLAAEAEPWDRENEQRAALGDFLKDSAGPDDLMLVGDIDEIPDKDAFGYLSAHKGPPLRLALHHGIYFANWLLPRSWTNSTLVFRPDHFRQPMVRLTLGDYHMDWEGYEELQLQDVGVHLSFLGGPDAIRAKVAAYSHQEFNDERFCGSPHLERCIEMGVHFQGRETLRRIARRELTPQLRRLSEQPIASSFFDFGAHTSSRFRSRAYCGYTWLRTRSRLLPDGALRSIDRHPGLTSGPGAPLFWLIDAALRSRRRLRPTDEWMIGKQFPRHLLTRTVLHWR